MKKIIISFFIFSFFAPMVLSAGEHPVPTVEKGPNGMYSQKLEWKSGVIMFYIADSITQICFAGFGEKSVIPCEKLKKRPEWKEFITWVQ